MDEEQVDPEDENVNSILEQESSELLQILGRQPPSVIMELYQMMPSGARQDLDNWASSAATLTKNMVEYYKTASAADCRGFFQSVCFCCESMPMRLESRLMSVAGYGSTPAVQSPAPEPMIPADTVSAGPSPSVTHKEPPPLPPSEQQQLIKRPRIDPWAQYLAAVMRFLQRRWERLSERLVGEVQLENVWVSPRTTNKGKDRPDQTPGSADRGGRTPESDGDFVSLDARVTLEIFLQDCEGKVTVLLGLAGSGKTLLMSCLGKQWANKLGPVPSTCLFVLLEFRQLNLLSRPVSLSELLFLHYLPPDEDHDQKRGIMDYLLSNPEQSCWVLDGYDEFHSKLARQEVQREPWDPETPLPVADLVSGLLNRQLLPGCTVVVTCRVRDAVDLESGADKVGQLLEWDRDQIEKYVHNFFGEKGHRADAALGRQAADLLLSTQHLLAMSSLPALCNICCICLEHLLLEGGGRLTDGTNGRARRPPTQALIPSTLTQVYLTVVGAFLSRDPHRSGRSEETEATQSPLSVVDVLSHFSSELVELSQLAWSGLEGGRILFTQQDLPQDVLEFSIRTGLLSQVELRREDGTLVNLYCFIHLTLQEFLAALRIMTSQEVDDMQLKKRFSLKTRWMTKSDQRTLFTDSLHLFVCGLASPQCTQALAQLALACGGAQRWVQKRQALVVKLLKNLCHSNLTGPKILELCHCVQESQDHQLAQQVLETRASLELRNIRLSPNDIDALAFVVNSRRDTSTGLDFRACSMELDCLDVLPKCQYIHLLCFRSRKYGDKFAEKLSSILPNFTSLRKLEFCGSSLTAAGAAALASALKKCPDITDINLNDNNLRDEGIKHITDIFTKIPKLVSVMLGRNNYSLKTLDYLIWKMSSCLNIQHLHADGTKELTVTFFPNSDPSSPNTTPEPTISLLNQKWSRLEMQSLSESLARCPAVSVLDLSGGHWDEETLKTLTQFLPKFNITQKIIVNNNCYSVDGLVILTALLSHCPAVTELHIRLQSPAQVCIALSGVREKLAREQSKTLCLSHCGLVSADLERVWKSLGTSCDVSVLNLSNNSLGDKGVSKLLRFLPRLHSIQEINASNNDVGMEGVVLLAGALCSHHNLNQVHISEGGREQVTLKFGADIESDGTRPEKVFRVNNSRIPPSDMTTLCRRLVQCDSQFELDLSHSPLTDKSIENLLRVLPKMTPLLRLDVSHSITSTSGALMLASCLTATQRTTSVEIRPHSDSLIRFDSVKAEQASCRLTHFSLNGDDLGRLLQLLQQGLRLSELDLSNNKLGDEGVKSFLDLLPGLEITHYVNLSNNCLTHQGLLDVTNKLSHVFSVEVSLGAEQRCLIWFKEDGVGERSLRVTESGLGRGHLLRLAEILVSCPSPTKVELRNNQLQPNWIAEFVEQLDTCERGTSVSIEETWIRSEEAVGLVCHCLDVCNNIHTIGIHHRTLYLSLMKTNGVTSVSLVDCDVEGHQLSSMRSVLQRCPLLTELDFSSNSLGAEGAEFLCSVLPSLPNLTSLSVGSKHGSCVTVVEKLSEALLLAAALQHLNLSGHVISDAAAHMLTRVLPQLRSLNLSHSVCSASVALQLITALRECVRLEGLCLDSVQLNEESRLYLAQALRNVSSIRNLKLNEILPAMVPSGTNDVLDLLAATEGLVRMEEIEMRGWRMADRGVQQLIQILPIWTGLRRISLSKNLISDQSGDKLLEALSHCVHLEELDLCSNSLGDLTAARMALVFPSLTHITVLDLSENHIGVEGSVSLSKAMMHMKKLIRINLTSVGNPVLCSVAASLAHCPHIQDVGLGWNHCGDEVAVELARVMPLCWKLTSIDLESNSVSVVGVKALARALQYCPAVQLIRLWRNKVFSSEAQDLRLRDTRLNFSST